MSEPKFKAGEVAEFQRSDTGWTPVYVESGPLRWAGRYHGRDNYLVQCVDVAARTGPPFLVYGSHLRRVEQWESCPGKHRLIGSTGGNAHYERRVD